MNTEYITCNSCKTKQTIDQFKTHKGEKLKSCDRCRERAQKQRDALKCEHGRQKCRCKECGGKSICEHSRRKIECIECGGSQICEHNKPKNRCIDCGGSSLCDAHKKRKDQCRECHPDPLHFSIMRILTTSKSSDKIKNMFDSELFIDYSHVLNLIGESENKCCYCSKEVVFNEYCTDMISIERIDTKKGHIKGNCAISCKDCNIGKVQRDHIKTDNKYKCVCGATMSNKTSKINSHVKLSKEHAKYIKSI